MIVRIVSLPYLATAIDQPLVEVPRDGRTPTGQATRVGPEPRKQRILTDIETARKSNDSQMVLRLGTVQQRIFAVETDAVEISKQAQFLEFRAKRLIEEYATLESRCSILGGIYD